MLNLDSDSASEGRIVNQSCLKKISLLNFQRSGFQFQKLASSEDEPSVNDEQLAQPSSSQQDKPEPRNEDTDEIEVSKLSDTYNLKDIKSCHFDVKETNVADGTDASTFQETISSRNELNNSSSHSSDIVSDQGSPSTSGKSGILSFLGFKLNKSSTRHLDRSASQGDSVDKSGDAVSSPNRYTKFPLRSGSRALSETSGQSNIISCNESPSSIRKRIERSSSSLGQPETSAPPSNSVFDANQIQSTAETRTYSNPNRSPAPPNRKAAAFSASNFLANAVSSLGKKTACSSSNKRSKSNFFNKLKFKSKSDNNLHRVDLNSSVANNAVLANIGCNSRNQGINRGQNTRLVATSSQNIYNPEPVGELRLNSVQIGDHATIHLPWTGIQRNNLSSASPCRRHQNTHSNNFESGIVRYVECGFQRSVEDNSCRIRKSSSSKENSSIPNSSCARKRSKSLERDHSFRVLSKNSLAVSSAGILTSSTFVPNIRRKESRNSIPVTGTRSLERKHPHSNYCIRQSLTPEEQEILLRNIKWDRQSSEVSTVPPPRPEKPTNWKSTEVSDCSFNAANKRSVFSISKSRRPPPIGVLHRSAPNSFNNSSDSSDSATFSAPPSPPPRPPSSLKPESRLISDRPAVLPKKNSDFSRLRSEFPAFAGGNFAASLNNSRSILPPLESSSDSGLSHTSCSSSTLRETSDFSEESAGSITINRESETLQTNFEKLTMSIEEARNSGFITKPSKGWLHSDQLLSKEGATYTVRYIGCLDVNTSMKSLDFDTRSLIAKECINQVCEAANLKSVDRRRKIDRRVMRIVGLRPRLDHAGSDVHLTITSTCLKLTSLDTGAVIAVHDMPNISFASGGDATMLDFVAYVAKDSLVGRACFVLECGSGLAQDVITTVGQAFELRFKEYIQKRPHPPRLPNDDPEYYNDLPGKAPPEVSSADSSQSSENKGKLNQVYSKVSHSPGRSKDAPHLTLPVSSERDFCVNLIDFEAPTPPAFGPSGQDRILETLLLGPDSPTFGSATLSSGTVNPEVGTGLGLPNSPTTQPFKDPFDMQPFGSIGNTLAKSVSAVEQRRLLEGEPWFHGVISRNEAEAILQNDGDFLVRESQTSPGQYVLTALQNKASRHLLLVDPEGVVRTKEHIFESVIHLVHHHCDNNLPIICAESIVVLRHPVSRVN